MIVSPRISSSIVRGKSEIQLEVLNMLSAHYERSAALEKGPRLSLL